MKPIHKGALGLLVLAAAGLTALSAAALRGGSPAGGEPARLATPAITAKAAAPPAETASPGGGAASKNNVYSNQEQAGAEGADGAPCVFGDRPAPVPEDLRVAVKTTPKGRVLTAERRGHLVSLRRGRDRRVALGKVDWSDPEGSGPIVWETTDPKTLETVRGEVSLGGADGAVALAAAVVPGLVEEDVSPAHACRGVSDGAAGFVVVCRVNGQAAAASVGTRDPREGVWSQAGDTTLVRFDLPMAEGGADAKVIGLEKQGRGVLLRVEASRVPGEDEALLAIGSDSRDQPHPIRRRGCICRLPIDPLL